jgi:hypothetical protein
MRLSKSQAALLNARELRLLTAKGPWEVSQLATHIRQVREMRDKQRDLLKRQDKQQARAGKGRVGATGTANERTAAKERLLDEALDGLQGELRRIDQESSSACRELLDDVPGRRANPRKATSKTGKASPARKAQRAAPSGGRGRASSKGTKATAKKSTAVAAKRPPAKRAAAKGPGMERSSKARVSIPRNAGGHASARPSLASRKARGTRAR